MWTRREYNDAQWNDDDEVRLVLDQQLDFHGASSLKQQSADRHVAPLGNIILIPSQPVFALVNYVVQEAIVVIKVI
jgi:hypothetical protein